MRRKAPSQACIFLVKVATIVVLSVSALVAQPVEPQDESAFFATNEPSVEAADLNDWSKDLLSGCLSGDSTNDNASAICQKLIEILSLELEKQRALNTIQVDRRREIIRFHSEMNRHTEAIFMEQLFAPRVIFWLSVTIVLFGIAASALQFYLFWKGVSRSRLEVEISRDAVSIKTAWIGLILLVISMMFFALYLSFVYGIEPAIS